MKLSNQVCSIEQAEKLKKLGVAQETLYYWTHSDWGIMPKRSIDFTGNPTAIFTAAELIQMKGNTYGVDFSERKKQYYTGDAVSKDIMYFDTFSQAIASVLIYSIEKEWITIEEVNKRLLEKD